MFSPAAQSISHHGLGGSIPLTDPVDPPFDLLIQDFLNEELGMEEKLQIMKLLRRQISRPHTHQGESPTTKFIAAGLPEAFVSILANDTITLPEMRFEAAWVLTNIASGSTEHTMAVVHSGALPVLTNILESQPMETNSPTSNYVAVLSNLSLKEQGVWALGNICGDGPSLRDLCLDHGLFTLLLSELRIVSQNASTELDNNDINNNEINPQGPVPLSATHVQNLLWTVGNIFRHGPLSDGEEMARNLIPILSILYRAETTDNYRTICSISWVVYYMSFCENHIINVIMQSDIPDILIRILHHDRWPVVSASLCCINKISECSSDSAALFIKKGKTPFLQRLGYLLSNPGRKIRRKAAAVVGNLAKDVGPEQTEVMLSGCDFVSKLLRNLKRGCLDTKTESAIALQNIICNSSMDQLQEHAAVGGSAFWRPIGKALSIKTANIRLPLLETIYDIFQRLIDLTDETKWKYTCPVEAAFSVCNIVEKLQAMKTSENPFQVVQLASLILLRFYSDKT